MNWTIAAILAADVAGFSRLVAQDEEEILRRFAEHGTIYRDCVAQFRGRVFNTAGDAILAEFPSAVDALRAAIAIQDILRKRESGYPPDRRIAFRMGLNIGDVVRREDGDLLGDGVNVAARLEGIAEPGGICIARSVHDAVFNKIATPFRDIGPQHLKNIPRPIHAFRVVWPSEAPERVLWRGSPVRDLLQRARRWWWMPVALPPLLAGAGLWIGMVTWPSATNEADRDGAEAEPLAVGVTPVRTACFRDEVWLGGVLVPRRDIDIRPDGDGVRILSVAAAPLARVAAGDVLARVTRAGGGLEGEAINLRAPVAGVVGRANAVPGAVVTAASPPLFQIIAEGEYDLAAEVQLAALSRLAPGQPATITPLGSQALAGQVRSVAVPADPGTQSGRVRIQIQAAADLRQGTFARAVVDIDNRCGLGLPSAAMMIGPEGRFVYVADGARIEARPIATGLTRDDLIEVRAGLKADELVVARAGPFLREGATIAPIRDPAPFTRD